MIQYFKSLFFTDTGKDTSIVFIGTLINVTAGGLFFILVPRILGPSDYGLFSTIVATGLMAATIANFGIDTGILRFTHKDSDQSNAIFSLALKSYLLSGLLIGVFGVLLAPILANYLNHPEIMQLLRIAFASIIFLLLTNFFVAGLQSKKEFLKASIVNISSNVARLAILVISFFFLSIGLYFLTILFFFITLVSVVVGKMYLSFRIVKTDKSLVKNYFKYNFWIAAALIISAIPFDNYFLLKLAGPVAAGLYAAPFKILTFSYQFGGNFTRVLASRFSSFDTNEKTILYAKKAAIIPVLLSLGLVFLVLFSTPITLLLFGEKYQQASQILQVLSIGFIFFFLSTIPSSIILYYFGKSSVSFGITLVRYFFFIALLLFLVPSQKALGGAIAFSTSEFAAFLLMIGYMLLKFQKSDEY